MTTEAAPPQYTPGSAPPSYEKVIGKLDAAVKANPTPSAIADAISNLSDAEKESLASHDADKLDFKFNEATPGGVQ
jgi:hypothetical protein